MNVSPWLRNSAKNALQRICRRDHFIWRLPPETGAALALTFDDGPHPIYTPAVLDLLARHDIKATFFVVGNRVGRHPDMTRRLILEGHGIGSHSFSHREIVDLTADELAWELEACQRAIQEAAGVATDMFRPPRGRISLRSINQVTALGYRIVHWSKTYGDYQCQDNGELLRRMQRKPARARDIVLLHDHNPVTVEVLATMIPAWRSAGLAFRNLNKANGIR